MANNSIGEALGNALRRLSGTDKKKDEKEIRDGEETLLRSLNKMYEAKRDKESPKPNYYEKYPIAKPEFSPPPVLSDYDLMAMADKNAKDKFSEKRIVAEKNATESIEGYHAKKDSAITSLGKSYQGVQEKAQGAKDRAEQKIAENGLYNSSIATGLRETAVKTAEELSRAAQARYTAAITEIDGKIATADEKLKGALKTFDISQAVAAEKDLKKLKTEREKDLKSFKKDYESALSQYEKSKTERADSIKEDESARDSAYRESLQNNGGTYSTAEVADMENRFKIAETFYTSIPKDKALNLVLNAADDLKFLLGNYYDQLVAKLRKS